MESKVSDIRMAARRLERFLNGLYPPDTVNPPLDDVVPGEPEPASHPLAR